MPEATTPKSEQKAEESQDPQHVTLDAETYAALLDRLDELETKETTTDDEPKDEVDELAREAKPQSQQQRPLDLNRMSNQQLAQFIASELTSDVLNPMLVRLSQMELRLEEKELTTEYPDFKEHKKDAYAVLHKNPSLSLEQAYHLAVKQKSNKRDSTSQDGKEGSESDSKGQARKGLLKHLPRRPASLGEKPSGAAGGDLKPARPTTVRGSAERAIDDMQIDFPSKGGNI